MPKFKDFGHIHKSHICIFQKAFLGDVLLTTPLIQGLLDLHCDITVLTHQQGKVLLDHFFPEGQIRTIVVQKPLAWWWRPLRTVKLACQYWKQFDVVLALHRGVESSLLARPFARLYALGFQDAEGAFLLHQTYPRQSPQHEVEKNHQFLTALWAQHEVPKAGWAKGTQKPEKELLSKWGIQAPYGIVHPGSRWVTKRWDKYHQLLQHCLQDANLSKIQWVMTGESSESAGWEHHQAMLSMYGIKNLIGKLTLSEYMHVCSNASVVVGNDSFSTHVASAYDVPCVSIFGSTVPEQGFSPLSTEHRVVQHPALSCRPCGSHGYMQCPKTHFDCMKEIQVDSVIQAIKGVLNMEASHA